MAETHESAEAKDGGGYDYKRLHSYPLVRVNFVKNYHSAIFLFPTKYF